MNTRSKSNSVFASIGGGIRKAARWVAKMFGYKAENKFARCVWYVFATSTTIVMLYLVVVLVIITVDDVIDDIGSCKSRRIANSPTYLHPCSNRYVSPYIVYHNSYPGYLYDTRLGQRTATGIHWICKSSDGDSLACFSSHENHKRGYINCFTGEVVIPAQYEKAWIFSEGLACVLDKGELRFIDHKGQSAFDKKFPYTERIDAYCFHNGLCQMLGDNNRIGLIDRQGNWVTDPEYYEIHYDKAGFWLVQDREWNYGMLDANGRMLLPVEYGNINIRHDDSCIFVTRLDHLQQVLDFGCNVINPCNYIEIERINYMTGECDEAGDMKFVASNCLMYSTDEWYFGLMDADGNILTPPVYSSITAISASRFHCIGPKGSVILDDKGNECGEKP